MIQNKKQVETVTQRENICHVGGRKDYPSEAKRNNIKKLVKTENGLFLLYLQQCFIYKITTR
jgi:hypothetical protein